jgi:hypothetical protein
MSSTTGHCFDAGVGLRALIGHERSRALLDPSQDGTGAVLAFEQMSELGCPVAMRWLVEGGSDRHSESSGSQVRNGMGAGPAVSRTQRRPMCRGLKTAAHRSDRNAARISSVKSCGCSQAAKWPPLSTSLKWTRLGYARLAQLSGAR